jgi:uroporphyrinogen-III synthase
MKKRVLVVGPSVPRRLTDDPSISVIHCPLIDLRPLPVDIAALKQIAAIRHVIITSKHAATFFHDALMQAAIDYTPQKAFCVGHETDECVRTIFPTTDILTASVATQEGVVDLVLSHHTDHTLWPRSSQARRHLPESLEKNGISFTELVLYAPVAYYNVHQCSRSVHFLTQSELSFFLKKPVL